MKPYSYVIPDEKTFLWKKIEILEIDDIHKEVLRHIIKVRPNNGRSFNYLNMKTLKNDCSQLMKWTENNNLNLSGSVIVDVSPANGSGKFRIHVDTSDPILFPNQLALNFPIISCINSQVWTSMYRCKGPPDSSGAFFHNIEYNEKKSKERILKFDDDFSKEITRFQYMDKNPILFNAKIPHAVQNYSNEARVTLSLRFKVDPIWLIK